MSWKLWKIFNALLTRLILFTHGAISICLLYQQNSPTLWHWLVVIPLLLLIVEGVVTIYYRQGRECKYFWPSGFLYITTIVPLIWFTHLNLLDKHVTNSTTNDNTTNIRDSRNKGWSFLGTLHLSDDFIGKNVCEVGMIIGIFLGRWLLPSRSISKEELTAMLLTCVGNGGDLLDLCSSTTVPGNSPLHPYSKICILVVFTWALMQFTLVTKPKKKLVALLKDIEQHGGRGSMSKGFQRIVRLVSSFPYKAPVSRTNLQYCTGQSDAPSQGSSQSVQPLNSRDLRWKLVKKLMKTNDEFIPILLALVMHEIPFVLVRLMLTLTMNVLTELHAFFLCKNFAICAVLSYRLYILTFHTKHNQQEFILVEDAKSDKNE